MVARAILFWGDRLGDSALRSLSGLVEVEGEGWARDRLDGRSRCEGSIELVELEAYALVIANLLIQKSWIA